MAHFPQKQDINQFKWRAMKFVERGGTTRRNRPQCAGFENHSASSHLPDNLPPLVNLGDSTQSLRVQDAHSVSILGIQSQYAQACKDTMHTVPSLNKNTF